jgi:nucleoside-diphosphate-sugar epimerase
MIGSSPSEKIWVTGAAGFVGTHLVRLLRASGCDVLPWTRERGDLLDFAVVNAVARANPPSIVFHMAAAGVRTPGAVGARLVDDNIAMVRNLIRAVPEGCTIVQGGTMAEYGYGGLLREDAICQPKTDYSRGKYEAGQVLAHDRTSGFAQSMFDSSTFLAPASHRTGSFRNC